MLPCRLIESELQIVEYARYHFSRGHNWLASLTVARLTRSQTPGKLVTRFPAYRLFFVCSPEDLLKLSTKSLRSVLDGFKSPPIDKIASHVKTMA